MNVEELNQYIIDNYNALTSELDLPEQQPNNPRGSDSTRWFGVVEFYRTIT